MFAKSLTKNIIMEKSKMTIPEQVAKALDGRTQRWLSFEVRIPEPDLSKKMKGSSDFSSEELKKIEERLSFKFEL
jgi:hypothetical protein